jgi:hypothetical protein
VKNDSLVIESKNVFKEFCMNKLLLFAFVFLSAVSHANSSDNVIYNCELMDGSHSRHGINKLNIAYGHGIHRGRVLITLIKTTPGRPTELSTPGVYAHEANIHKGRFAGFMKYTPSKRFNIPDLFTMNFPSFAMNESRDRKSAVVAFPESKNAVYSCTRF